jgi:hypothetical protein
VELPRSRGLSVSGLSGHSARAILVVGSPCRELPAASVNAIHPHEQHLLRRQAVDVNATATPDVLSARRSRTARAIGATTGCIRADVSRAGPRRTLVGAGGSNRRPPACSTKDVNRRTPTNSLGRLDPQGGLQRTRAMNSRRANPRDGSCPTCPAGSARSTSNSAFRTCFQPLIVPVMFSRLSRRVVATR